MKKQLLDYIYSDNFKEISYNGVKKYLGVSRKHLDNEVKKMLFEFELEGLLYEDKDGLYKKFPSNFFVSEISSTGKGTKYISINDKKILMKENNLKGALPYDKVIISNKDGKYKVEKILIRRLPK